MCPPHSPTSSSQIQGLIGPAPEIPVSTTPHKVPAPKPAAAPVFGGGGGAFGGGAPAGGFGGAAAAAAAAAEPPKPAGGIFGGAAPSAPGPAAAGGMPSELLLGWRAPKPFKVTPFQANTQANLATSFLCLSTHTRGVSRGDLFYLLTSNASILSWTRLLSLATPGRGVLWAPSIHPHTVTQRHLFDRLALSLLFRGCTSRRGHSGEPQRVCGHPTRGRGTESHAVSLRSP
jgi:hypothetical protein